MPVRPEQRILREAGQELVLLQNEAAERLFVFLLPGVLLSLSRDLVRPSLFSTDSDNSSRKSIPGKQAFSRIDDPKSLHPVRVQVIEFGNVLYYIGTCALTGERAYVMLAFVEHYAEVPSDPVGEPLVIVGNPNFLRALSQHARRSGSGRGVRPEDCSLYTREDNNHAESKFCNP